MKSNENSVPENEQITIIPTSVHVTTKATPFLNVARNVEFTTEDSPNIGLSFSCQETAALSKKKETENSVMNKGKKNALRSFHVHTQREITLKK
jgi:hypothetical protein